MKVNRLSIIDQLINDIYTKTRYTDISVEWQIHLGPICLPRSQAAFEDFKVIFLSDHILECIPSI